MAANEMLRVEDDGYHSSKGNGNTVKYRAGMLH